MDDKVYYPQVIEETPLPQGDAAVSYNSSQSTSGGTTQPSTIKDQTPPTKRVAVELIGSSLNTKSKKILGEFQFTQSGAIQVGKYTNGVSGDIKISPSGIVARNQSGITTIAIDGDTGDATFAGTIQAGTLISGSVVVGDNNVIIDGEQKNIIINDGTYDRILIGYQAGGF